jgi:hypothetical protein
MRLNLISLSLALVCAISPALSLDAGRSRFEAVEADEKKSKDIDLADNALGASKSRLKVQDGAKDIDLSDNAIGSLKSRLRQS